MQFSNLLPVRRVLIREHFGVARLSTVSTQEIEQMIGTLWLDTVHAVNTMQTGSHLVQSTLDGSRATKERSDAGLHAVSTFQVSTCSMSQSISA